MTLEYCLKDIGKVITGKTPKTAIAENFGVDYPFITPRDMNSDKYTFSTERYLSEQGKNSVKNMLLPINSICVSCIGSDMGKVTKTTCSSVTNQQINSIIVNEKIAYHDYVYYDLINRRDELKQRASGGTALPIINKTTFESLDIYLPSLEVQKRIADILSSLDDKITLNREINKTLESMAQAIFKSWFIDFEPFKEGEFVESELGMIPKGWEVKPLTDCTKVIGGGTPKTSIPEYWNGDIPWFSVVDTPSGSDVFVVETEKSITQEGLKNSSTKLLDAGTTIVTARGTVGKIALAGTAMTMNQSCYALAPIDETPYFTYYLVSSSIVELKQKTHGSVFDTITRETLSSIQVVMPNVDAIKEFEFKVESMMLKIKENLLETKTLSTLRDTLLPKLLSGEMEV